MNATTPLGTILCHLWFQTPLSHILIYTFLPRLSSPHSATLSLHFNSSAGSYPLLILHSLKVTKPPQSTSRHHLCHTINTQTRDQLLTILPFGQGHTTHPSYHRPLSAL